MDELVKHSYVSVLPSHAFMLASASNRAFSFASLSLRTSTRLHTSVILGPAWNAYDKSFRIIKKQSQNKCGKLVSQSFCNCFLGRVLTGVCLTALL